MAGKVRRFEVINDKDGVLTVLWNKNVCTVTPGMLQGTTWHNTHLECIEAGIADSERFISKMHKALSAERKRLNILKKLEKYHKGK
jgi:glycerol-3-phosphate dehydrogenase